jgi:acetyl-CoA C-acetyltransferase
MEARKVVVVGGVRTPFLRAGTGFANVKNEDLMTAALKALADKFNLKGKRVGDVSLGAVMTHTYDWNIAREAVLGAGLSPETPGFNLQRACGTSLEAAILIANKIALGQIEVGIAGGLDSMSDVPIEYQRSFIKILLASSRGRSFFEKLKPWFKLRPKDLKPKVPGVTEPRTKLSMGEHCELMAKEWKLTRAEQDELAYQSHQHAAAAWKRGFFSDLVAPAFGAQQDNIVRGDTTMEKLAKLKPVFDRKAGTLTAGNSTPLTDGASAALLCSEDYARKNNLPIQAYFVDCEVAAVNFLEHEGLLMAPAYAVARMLTRRGLKLQDFDFYEIHEAFAAQVLCTLKAWESDDFCRNKLGLPGALGKIDRAKLNVNGGSVAVGHPFGATGTRIVATLAKLLQEKGRGRGLISICTGGGMGVTAILEKP